MRKWLILFHKNVCWIWSHEYNGWYGQCGSWRENYMVWVKEVIGWLPSFVDKQHVGKNGKQINEERGFLKPKKEGKYDNELKVERKYW